MARKASSEPESSKFTATIGFEHDIGKEHSDSSRNVQLPDLCADHILAYGSVSSNRCGDCPTRSASLKPNAKSQSQPRQSDIRRAIINADLVDTAPRDSAIAQSETSPQVVSKAKCKMVAFLGQLFYCTQIPFRLWFLAKNKATDAKRGFRDRCQQPLFIDARKLGTHIDRVHRELTNAKLDEHSNAHFHSGTASRVFVFHLN